MGRGGGGVGLVGPHLINWAIVCMGETDKGLGIRILYMLNKALLRKWF